MPADAGAVARKTAAKRVAAPIRGVIELRTVMETSPRPAELAARRGIGHGARPGSWPWRMASMRRSYEWAERGRSLLTAPCQQPRAREIAAPLCSAFVPV